MTDKKTVDDLFHEKVKKEQDEFDEAFDEIIEGDKDLQKVVDGGAAQLKKDEKGTALKDGTDGSDDDKSKSAKDGDEDEDKTPSLLKGPEDQDGSDGSDDSDTDDDDDKDKKIKELEDKLKSEEQRNKSWGGRISAANKRADEAEARAKELEKKIESFGDHGKRKKPEDDNSSASLNEDDEKVLSQFQEDFPELTAPLKVLLKKANAGQKDAIMEEIKPKLKKVDEVAESQKQTADSAHVRAIREAHPDIEKILEKDLVVQWIETQPSYLQPGLMNVYQKGSTQDAIDLITEFKRVTGYDKTKDKSKSNESKNGNDKEAKLKSMVQVDSDSSGPPAGEPDKSDFDSAAKEAGL